MQAAQSAAESIADGDGAALSLLAGALSSLREMAEIDRGLAEMVSLIEAAEVNLQEAAQSLRQQQEIEAADKVDFDTYLAAYFYRIHKPGAVILTGFSQIGCVICVKANLGLENVTLSGYDARPVEVESC
jgi:hypothetical protein